MSPLSKDEIAITVCFVSPSSSPPTLTLNEQVYARLHHNLLHQPTRREKQLSTYVTRSSSNTYLSYKKRYGTNKLCFHVISMIQH